MTVRLKGGSAFVDHLFTCGYSQEEDSANLLRFKDRYSRCPAFLEISRCKHLKNVFVMNLNFSEDYFENILPSILKMMHWKINNFRIPDIVALFVPVSIFNAVSSVQCGMILWERTQKWRAENINQ